MGGKFPERVCGRLRYRIRYPTKVVGRLYSMSVCLVVNGVYAEQMTLRTARHNRCLVLDSGQSQVNLLEVIVIPVRIFPQCSRQKGAGSTSTNQAPSPKSASFQPPDTAPDSSETNMSLEYQMPPGDFENHLHCRGRHGLMSYICAVVSGKIVTGVLPRIGTAVTIIPTASLLISSSPICIAEDPRT